MSDIVDKLRSQIGDDVSQVYDKEALFRAAADEIMHLRSACDEWAEVSQRNYQRAKAAEAESDRLRDEAQERGNLFHRIVDLPAPGAVPRNELRIGDAHGVDGRARRRIHAVLPADEAHDLADALLDRRDIGARIVEPGQDGIALRRERSARGVG